MKIDALTKFVRSIAPAKKETPKEPKKESKRTEKQDKRDKRETREEKERATERETREEKETREREREQTTEDAPPPPAVEISKGEPYLYSIIMSLFNIHFSGTRYPRARRRSYLNLNLLRPQV